MRLLARAYAKVNPCLDVLAKKEDGYHEIDYILQSISLFDELFFEEAAGLSLEPEGRRVPIEGNLVLRAAALLRGEAGTKKGARIRLRKQIPIEAGLGGGSADAAAALCALNLLWGLKLPPAALHELAARLGADVPFCLRGGTARARGIGTDLEFFTPREELSFVLVKPKEGLLTKAVFAAWDGLRNPRHPMVGRARNALIEGDFEAFAGAMGNGLEEAAQGLCPGVGRALLALRKAGARGAAMSGSGSAVLGLFDGQAEAERAAALCGDVGESFAVQTRARGLEIEECEGESG
ncbi:MAG: 4-(cytidine 5'-diphospho)-2-C-methyl-D-erythritol kinase [Christensenellaceae bacterium]|nr:4-(cytidine 5'-diphospho)-2-C-methyl-D-erythritol kinase [Christensenellaceae bacterium]